MQPEGVHASMLGPCRASLKRGADGSSAAQSGQRVRLAVHLASNSCSYSDTLNSCYCRRTNRCRTAEVSCRAAEWLLTGPPPQAASSLREHLDTASQTVVYMPSNIWTKCVQIQPEHSLTQRGSDSAAGAVGHSHQSNAFLLQTEQTIQEQIAPANLRLSLAVEASHKYAPAWLRSLHSANDSEI